MAAKNTAAAEPKQCECAKYSAVDPAELTEENLASGDYQELTTGCTATTKNLFAQGHDARLKGFLIRAGAAGLEVARHDGGVRVSGTAQGWADKFNFGRMVRDGIKRAELKELAKQERADARAAKQAEAKAAQTRRTAAKTKEMAKKTKAEETAQVVKAKVSRWTYTGVVEKGVFHYSDSKGNAKTAVKFQIV